MNNSVTKDDNGSITVEEMGEEFQVRFNVGVQHFDIGPRYPTKEEANWMQQQFATAQKRFINIVTGIESISGSRNEN